MPFSSSAPIAAFRKRDKHEKDDIVQERIPQGQPHFSPCAKQLPNTPGRNVLLMFFFLSCFQMSRCPDRAVKCRRRKTSWTSTGTSRGAARVTEPRVEPPTTGREVKMKLRCRNIPVVGAVDLILLLWCRYLRRGRRPRLLQRRRPAEHLCRRSPGLGQPDGPAARLQVFLQVFVLQPTHKLALTHSDSLNTHWG